MGIRSRLASWVSSRSGKWSLWAGNTVAGAILGSLAYGWAQPMLASMGLDANAQQAQESVQKLDDLLALARKSNQLDAELLMKFERAVADTRNTLKSLDESVRLIRNDSLKKSGFDLAADFYLSVGQGARIGGGHDTFGVMRRVEQGESTRVTVSINGSTRHLEAGERITFKSSKGSCYVGYIGESKTEKLQGFVTGCVPESEKS